MGKQRVVLDDELGVLVHTYATDGEQVNFYDEKTKSWVGGVRFRTVIENYSRGARVITSFSSVKEGSKCEKREIIYPDGRIEIQRFNYANDGSCTTTNEIVYPNNPIQTGKDGSTRKDDAIYSRGIDTDEVVFYDEKTKSWTTHVHCRTLISYYPDGVRVIGSFSSIKEGSKHEKDEIIYPDGRIKIQRFNYADDGSYTTTNEIFRPDNLIQTGKERSVPEEVYQPNYISLSDSYKVKLLSSEEVKAKDQAFITAPYNRDVLGYEKTPKEIQNLIYHERPNGQEIPPAQRLIFKKIYQRVTPQLTVDELRLVIKFAQRYDFDNISLENQQALLMNAVQEMQKHPLLKETFLYQNPDNMNRQKILMGPEVTNYLNSIGANGCLSDRNFICLSDMLKMDTFLHESRHAQQKALGTFLDNTDSRDATLFMSKMAAEAEAKVYSNLIQDQLGGLSDHIYQHYLKKNNKNKIAAEKQYMATMMELYFAEPGTRENVLKKHHIPVPEQLILVANGKIDGWRSYYTKHYHCLLAHNNADSRYDPKKIEELNNYYKKLYNENIDVCQFGSAINLSDTQHLIITGERYPGKSYNSLVYGTNGETILHLAVAEGDISHIDNQTIAEYVNKTNGYGETPLTVACRTDNGNRNELIKELIGKGANPNFPVNECCLSPLGQAVLQHDEKAVKLLLACGANHNLVFKDNKTPMVLAVNSNNQKSVELFLKHGANLNSYYKQPVSVKVNGRNVRQMCKIPLLTQVVSNQHLDMLEFFLKNGANPNIDVEVEFGSPLVQAILQKDEKAVTLLLKYGASPTKKLDKCCALDCAESLLRSATTQQDREAYARILNQLKNYAQKGNRLSAVLSESANQEVVQNTEQGIQRRAQAQNQTALTNVLEQSSEQCIDTQNEAHSSLLPPHMVSVDDVHGNNPESLPQQRKEMA